MLDQVFPEIAVLTNVISILQNTLSISVLLLQTLVGTRIYRRRELEARSSRKVFKSSDVSKFKRSILKSSRSIIVLVAP